jgi:hypothetical protein
MLYLYSAVLLEWVVIAATLWWYSLRAKQPKAEGSLSTRPGYPLAAIKCSANGQSLAHVYGRETEADAGGQARLQTGHQN